MIVPVKNVENSIIKNCEKYNNQKENKAPPKKTCSV